MTSQQQEQLKFYINQAIALNRIGDQTKTENSLFTLLALAIQLPTNDPTPEPEDYDYDPYVD